jgi:hypothetical protein
LGQCKLIVHTVARDPNVQLRINPAGVEKMSDVLLRFAEPILDRWAPLDDKKATLLFAMSAWNLPAIDLMPSSPSETTRTLVSRPRPLCRVIA